ncbi:isopeptide-forming domain-containing fimbrial protein [Bifidobacterium bombi]|uniref:Putative fimbrial subunit FimA n=1 Tax=Bifidobacterium bombi DSM 19703 TaxID=1341695 RepID=A0A080N4M4_9BIFI|nr:isopeptide-forming domain-containing fimbrial protein [Bifidobacterium bombi]KFF31530.1 putative fimbrial subunit FimA [Bifidobacterium bombi DSM 19703]
MMFHGKVRRFVGASVAAASLLALAPMGITANAADAADSDSAPIAVPAAGQSGYNGEIITIKGANAENMKNHTFSVVRIGDYEDAAGKSVAGGDGSASYQLTSVSVGTDQDVLTLANNALAAARDKNDQPDSAYAGNPVGEVAATWLGYDGGSENRDKVSNSGSDADAWGKNGNLRRFVTELAKQKDFLTKLQPVTATTLGDTATFTVAQPGLYVIEDTTEAASKPSNPKQSIPMLVCTGITSAGNNYNQLNGRTLGEIAMKNDDEPGIKKTLDVANSDIEIGGILNYKLSGTVPLTTGFTHYLYTMVDSPVHDGLTYIPDDSGSAATPNTVVKVTWTDADGKSQSKTLVQGTDYLVQAIASTTDNGLSTAHVVFDLSPVICSLQYKASISVTYKMRLNDSAQDGPVQNSAALSYSTDVNHQPATDKAVVNTDGTIASDAQDGANNNSTVSTTTPTDPNQGATTYFRDFNLVKKSKALVDSGAKDQTLVGAEFQVFDGDSKNPMYFRPMTDNGALAVPSSHGSYKKAQHQDGSDKNAVTTLRVADDDAQSAIGLYKGMLKVDGLKDGSTYIVKETKAPAGFSSTFLPIFKVTVHGATASDNNGGFPNDAQSVTTNTGDAWGLVRKNSTPTLTTNAGHTIDNAIVVLNVSSISQLPLTGGAGVILALLVVVVLMVAMGLLLLARRRLNR